MRTSWRTLVLVLLLGAATSVAGQDPLAATVQKRQEKVRSLDIKFHVKEFVAKGSYSALSAAIPGSKSGVAPAKDLTIESDNRLLIDGDKARFESNHPIWSLHAGDWTYKPSISVTNGELSKVFYPDGIGTDPELTGIIRGTARSDELNSYLLVPVLMHFRGSDPELAPYLVTALKKGAGVLPISGTVCEEYQHPLSKDSIVEFWYDSASYDLKRVRKLRRAAPYEQTEIQYQPALAVGTTPMSWVQTEYDAGKVRRTVTVTVTDIKVNPTIDAGEFEITFPPGTHVHDQRVRKEYRVQESGDMRELDLYGQEVGGSVAQPGTPWWSRNRWLLASGALVLVVLAVLLLRGWRKGREPEGPSTTI